MPMKLTDLPSNSLPHSGWSNEWLTEDSNMALVGNNILKEWVISYRMYFML